MILRRSNMQFSQVGHSIVLCCLPSISIRWFLSFFFPIQNCWMLGSVCLEHKGCVNPLLPEHRNKPQKLFVTTQDGNFDISPWDDSWFVQWLPVGRSQLRPRSMNFCTPTYHQWASTAKREHPCTFLVHSWKSLIWRAWSYGYEFT